MGSIFFKVVAIAITIGVVFDANGQAPQDNLQAAPTNRSLIGNVAETPMQVIAFGGDNPTQVASPGTYQVLRRLNSPDDALPPYAPNMIETLRDQSEIKIWQISDNLRIKILPYVEITRPDFTPIEPQTLYMEF